MKTSQRVHPDWALKQKRPGTELRYIRGNYYLYGVSSKWNKEKKRAQKVTGKILGRVTENGFIESTRRQILDREPKIENAATPTIKSVSTKSAGLGCFLEPLLSDVLAALRKSFDQDADAIYCASLMRLAHQTPLKNMNVHLQENYLSESFPSVSLADKKVSSLLRSIGADRERINGFFREFSRTGENILMDITAIHSKSEQMSINQRGYNAKGSFDPQANLLLLFSQSRREPVYYRVLPGNIRDVKSVQLTMYKARMEVETAFDAFKNTLEADRSYMHSDQSFAGWMFINYVALLAYWRMLKVLMAKELLAKFSINDLIMYLSYIRKVKINGSWHLAEITDKTKRLLAKLECHIT